MGRPSGRPIPSLSQLLLCRRPSEDIVAKVKTSFICQQCGASSHAYLGRCPGCGAWNSMIETIEERPQPARAAARRPAELPQPLTALGATAIERIPVPISELDRVLGGGLVPGTLVLIGGDPGIGKSTLVLQAVAADRGFDSDRLRG